MYSLTTKIKLAYTLPRRTARDEETSSMSDSLQSVMSSLEEKGARLQQALQESRVADSRLEQVRLAR